MEQTKKPVGFGFRGTMLIIYQALGYAVYTAFTNFPSNVLSANYGGATTTTLMTLIGTPLGFVISYFIIAPNIGKIKSFKKLLLILGPIALAFSVLICIIPAQTASGTSLQWVWAVCFLFNNQLMSYWGCSFATYIIGNWFPRRKGTVMGYTTMAFPIVTGICLSFFYTVFYGTLASSGGNFTTAALVAFAPWWALGVIAWLICLIFITDYPEQCGCYRDNDPSFTKEEAMAMMMADMENRKNSVWTRSKIWPCKDYYMLSLPSGILLSCAMAFMVQIIPCLSSYGSDLDVLIVPGFVLMSSGVNAALFGLAIFALFGSWFLGVLDTKYGTKTAIFITSWVMLAAGILGMIGNIFCTVAATWLLGLFMGAASNFGLSAIVRYYRREDFQAVMAGAPPVGLIITAPISYIMAALGKIDYKWAFLLVCFYAVACIVMNRLFNEKTLADYDNKLRAAAGKPVDNVLYDRIGQEKRAIEAKKAAK